MAPVHIWNRNKERKKNKSIELTTFNFSFPSQ